MIIIFDIDGTLSDPSHRRGHLKNRDWGSFFDEMGDDPPKEEYCTLARILLKLQYQRLNTSHGIRSELTVLFATGRPDNYRKITEAWLRDNVGLYEHEYNHIYMRKAGDTRADYIVKQEILDQIKEEYGDDEIELVVDDRPTVVDMWKRNGLRVLVAPGWDREGYEVPRVPTLHMMIGPSGAGKTHFIENELAIDADSVVSSDKMREQLLGDWRDQSKNDIVFYAVNSLVKHRIGLGLDTVLDATNIRNRDRRKVLDMLDRSVNIVYHVVDRPMEEKKRTDTWRHDVEVKGKPLMEYHQQTFNSNMKDILAGDGDRRVTVIDSRKQDGAS